MAEPRRMICASCEYQAPWMEFGAEQGAERCPRCGAESIRYADTRARIRGGDWRDDARPHPERGSDLRR